MIGGKIKSGRARVTRKTPREAWEADIVAAALAGDDELEAVLLEIGETNGYVDSEGRVLRERSESEDFNDAIRQAAKDNVTDLDTFRRRARDTSDR